MILGSEVAIPEACITKEDFASSSHHPRHRETKLLVHRNKASYSKLLAERIILRDDDTCLSPLNSRHVSALLVLFEITMRR